MVELAVRAGPVDPSLREEFPGLCLQLCEVCAAAGGRTHPDARRRLRALSDRLRGARALALRTTALGQAYRAFYRQIGLDPDTDPIPSERAARTALLHGGLPSENRLTDALLIALVETGVPVWALGATSTDAGTLGIRLSGEREREQAVAAAAGAPWPLAPGQIVVADAHRIHAPLFAAPPRPGRRERTLVLFTVGVPGVPQIHLEEALWQAAELLAPE